MLHHHCVALHPTLYHTGLPDSYGNIPITIVDSITKTRRINHGHTKLDSTLFHRDFCTFNLQQQDIVKTHCQPISVCQNVQQEYKITTNIIDQRNNTEALWTI